MSKKELLKKIEMMRDQIIDLPQHAMLMPLTHYDLLSLLSVLVELLEADCIADS